MAADPIELIHILYEHALDQVRDARGYLAAGDIRARSNAISRAIAALTELDSSLDRQSGGSVSQNLAELYQYMRTRLLEANIHQKDAPLAEVQTLLKTLGEAWISVRASAPVAAPAPAAAPAWGGGFPVEPDAEYAAQTWSA